MLAIAEMMHCTRRRMWPAPEDQTFPTVVFLQVCAGTSRTGDSLLGKDNVTSAHVFVIKPITQNALTSTRPNSVAWNVFSFSHVCQLCSMWTTGKSLEFSDNCCMLVPPLGIRSLLFHYCGVIKVIKPRFYATLPYLSLLFRGPETCCYLLFFTWSRSCV